MTDREKLTNIVCNAMQNECVGHCNHKPCTTVEIVVDDLLTNGVTVQQMTSIMEETPSGECLAVNDCGTYMVGKIVKDPYSTVTGYTCMSNSGGTEVGIEDVTHWMPLPELPKED